MQFIQTYKVFISSESNLPSLDSLH